MASQQFSPPRPGYGAAQTRITFGGLLNNTVIFKPAYLNLGPRVSKARPIVTTGIRCYMSVLGKWHLNSFLLLDRGMAQLRAD